MIKKHKEICENCKDLKFIEYTPDETYDGSYSYTYYCDLDIDGSGYLQSESDPEKDFDF